MENAHAAVQSMAPLATQVPEAVQQTGVEPEHVVEPHWTCVLAGVKHAEHESLGQYCPAAHGRQLSMTPQPRLTGVQPVTRPAS